MYKCFLHYRRYVILGLSRTKDPASGVRANVLIKLLPLFTGGFESRPSSLLVMRRLSEINLDLLVVLFRIGFKRATSAQELVEIEKKLSNFGAIRQRLEDEGSADELLGLWCILADRGEMKRFEVKLVKVMEKNMKFAKYLVGFCRKHLESLRVSSHLEGGLLSIENFFLVLRVLRNAHDMVTTDELALLAEQANHFLLKNPTLQEQVHQESSITLRRPEMTGNGNLSSSPISEVEDIANRYFEEIYSFKLSVPDTISLLTRLKTSSEPKEQNVFRCMMSNLFDEYRFFHKYPDRELLVTGEIFGLLISHHLVSNITIGIALRYVLEAIRKDPENLDGEKLFRFGRTALEKFQSRLSEWPQYCAYLVQIPHLGKHCPVLLKEVQCVMDGKQTSNSAVGARSTSGVETTSVGVFVQHREVDTHDCSDNNSTSADVSAIVANYKYSPVWVPSEKVDSATNQQTQSYGSSLSSSVSSASPQLKITPSKPTALSSREEKVVFLAEIDRMGFVNQELPNTFTPPPEAIGDQIHFIINNIAKNNVVAKSIELKELLPRDSYPWFANYLVVKRLCAHVNLHGLYISLLDAFSEDRSLTNAVSDSVFYNVTKLLQSKKITTSTSERTILKNLGTWLGLVTIAQDKPLLQRRIDLKELLLWGYENGRLIAVCSFVAKILEGSKDSRVFRPPNPWLMAILGVMRELYELEDLKMNLKFEVQVLCNNINIRIEDIPPASLLPGRRMPSKIKNPDFNIRTESGGVNGASPTFSPPPPLSSNASPFPSGTLPAKTISLPPSAMSTNSSIEVGRISDTDIAGSRVSLPIPNVDVGVQSTVIPNLASRIYVNPNLRLLDKNPECYRFVLMAVDRGIKEIFQSVVESCVSIAFSTTRALVLQDFAQEPREHSLISAAQLMVTGLASSLSLVTCKEPLRLSICNHLRILMAQIVDADPNDVEEVLRTISTDNLDLSCGIIERAVIERVMQQLEITLAPAIEVRRGVREAGQSFNDTSEFSQGSTYPKSLPGALRPQTGGLHPIQMSIYEGFHRSRVSKHANIARLGSQQSIGASLSGNRPPTHTTMSLLVQQHQLQQQHEEARLTPKQASEYFQKSLQGIEEALSNIFIYAQGREITLSMLRNDHEIITLVKDLIVVIEKVDQTMRAETALGLAERVWRRLVETLTVFDTLRIEIFVGIIEVLRDIPCAEEKLCAEKVLSWVKSLQNLCLSEESGRKTHRTILAALLHAKLLSSFDIDRYMARNLDDGRNMAWVEHSLGFVRQCLSDGLAATSEFTETFETISRMRPTNPAVRQQLQKWLVDLGTLAKAKEEQHTAVSTVISADNIDSSSTDRYSGTTAQSQVDAVFREKVKLLLGKWICIWQGANDTMFNQYLQLMHQHQVMTTFIEHFTSKFLLFLKCHQPRHRYLGQKRVLIVSFESLQSSVSKPRSRQVLPLLRKGTKNVIQTQSASK